MSKRVKLFVDDVRKPFSPNWIVARTVTRAIEILATREVSEVSLDRDIICVADVVNEHMSRETFEAVAYYISAMAVERRPKIVDVHSANSEGARKIMEILSGKVQILRRRPPISGGMSLT